MPEVHEKNPYAIIPPTDIVLEMIFHIARYLAFGLNNVITTPAERSPSAAQTIVTLPVSILASD